MRNVQIETLYPLTFRKEEVQMLGDHLRHRHSVELIGMNRVGVSNFLNFVLYRKGVIENYVSKTEKHFFIPVDLNDLIELELTPFWILTFKRIIDASNNLQISSKIKQNLSHHFLRAIQLQDTFMAIEGIRECLSELIAIGYFPTVFYIRFDRFKEVINTEFLTTLHGIARALDDRLAYVFTSYRDLADVSPSAFSKKSLFLFSHPMYLKPASDSNSNIILDELCKKYHVPLSNSLKALIVDYSGGHAQYIQLSLLVLSEKLKKKKFSETQCLDIIAKDERINLLSEEIWESLLEEEQLILRKLLSGKIITPNDMKIAKYLWDTGLISPGKGKHIIFSQFFRQFIDRTKKKNVSTNQVVELTKKEHELFNTLNNNLHEICDREQIIEKVWPEYSDLAVSDWTIDRLISRLRNKLALQNSSHEIITVKTRGYKMVLNK